MWPPSTTAKSSSHRYRTRPHHNTLFSPPRGKLGLDIKDKLVPGSDGAGVVEAVGSNVRQFQPGDRVCTHMTRDMPDDAPATFADILAGLGQKLDGTLRPYGVFHTPRW